MKSLSKQATCICLQKEYIFDFLKKNKAFTLVEILVSMTILLTVCLVLFNMFHASLKYSMNVKSGAIAAVLAEKKIEEIRAWAYRFDDAAEQYNFNSEWVPYSSYTGADSDNPDFQVAVKVRKGGPTYYLPPNDNSPFYFPSTGTEKEKLFKRTMNNSMARVQVTISWDKGRKNFTTVTCIAEPARQLSSVSISNISSHNPLLKDSKNIYEATGYDVYNKKIDDLVFKWYVFPSSGNGEVIYFPEPDPRPSPVTTTGHDPVLGNGSSARDPVNYTKGKRAVFVHRIRSFEWTPQAPRYIYVNPQGTCKVMVRAQSGGAIRNGYTGDITVKENP